MIRAGFGEFVLVGMLLVVPACSDDDEPAADGVDSAAEVEEDPLTDPLCESTNGQVGEILEAVFRYQFDHNRAGNREPAAACLLLSRDLADTGWVGEGEDPTEAFMSRFADDPIVESASACGWDIVAGCYYIIYLETGEDALVFYIDSLEWIDETHVEVVGGYDEACLSSSGVRYYLERTGCTWALVDAVLEWIS